jgi:hypothetical protein
MNKSNSVNGGKPFSNSNADTESTRFGQSALSLHCLSEIQTRDVLNRQPGSSRIRI